MTTIIEQIRAEIERLNNLNKQIAKEQGSTDFIRGITAGYAEVLSFLDTLQEPEVDLEEEIDRVIADYSFTKTIDSGGFKTTILNYPKIARHFYELGKNAK